MFSYGNKNHRVVYVDTNVLSNICKPNPLGSDGLPINRESLIIKYINRFPVSENVLAYSFVSQHEMTQNDAVFEMYKNQFFIIPNLIMNGGVTLSTEEFAAAADKRKLEPEIMSPLWVEINGKKLDPSTLHLLFSEPKVIAANINLRSFLQNLFDFATNLRDRLGFTEDEDLNKKQNFEKFIYNCQVCLIEKFQPEIFKQWKKHGWPVGIETQLCFKMMAYLIFYKFYSDNRKPTINDSADILIASTLPYIDVFISESNVIDIIKKIKKKDDFIEHVELLTLSELQS